VRLAARMGWVCGIRVELDSCLGCVDGGRECEMVWSGLEADGIKREPLLSCLKESTDETALSLWLVDRLLD
jgi:hypothetical protein